MRWRFVPSICLALVVLLLGIVVCLCLWFGHPSEYDWLPPCQFRVWTGLLCPGCGTSRATHYFLNGQFGMALQCQPLLISLLPIIALLAGKVCYEYLRKTTVTLPFEMQLYWLILIVVLLFFVFRNIPLDCLDCLRPPSSVRLTG